MPKLTDSDIYTCMAVWMFACMYAYDLQWFLMSLVGIITSEVTIVLTEYANQQAEFYITYLQYMKDHRHDD